MRFLNPLFAHKHNMPTTLILYFDWQITPILLSNLVTRLLINDDTGGSFATRTNNSISLTVVSSRHLRWVRELPQPCLLTGFKADDEERPCCPCSLRRKGSTEVSGSSTRAGAEQREHRGWCEWSQVLASGLSNISACTSTTSDLSFNRTLLLSFEYTF